MLTLVMDSSSLLGRSVALLCEYMRTNIDGDHLEEGRKEGRKERKERKEGGRKERKEGEEGRKATHSNKVKRSSLQADDGEEDLRHMYD